MVTKVPGTPILGENEVIATAEAFKQDKVITIKSRESLVDLFFITNCDW